MPTLISRGAAAARGYGVTGSNSGQLYRETFTSNGTFTPRTGVTNITTLVGQGGSAQGDYPEFYQNFYVTRVLDNGSGSGGASLPIPWSTIAAEAVSVYNAFNAGGDQSGFFWDTKWYYFYSNNTYDVTNLGSNNFPYYTYPGWLIYGTGLVPYPPVGDAYYGSFGSYAIQGMFQQYGSDGTNSSALGYTFPAATLSGAYPNRPSQAATPVTYNNLAVTPGTGYPIVVGAGGSVQITYIIP